MLQKIKVQTVSQYVVTSVEVKFFSFIINKHWANIANSKHGKLIHVGYTYFMKCEFTILSYWNSFETNIFVKH